MKSKRICKFMAWLSLESHKFLSFFLSVHVFLCLLYIEGSCCRREICHVRKEESLLGVRTAEVGEIDRKRKRERGEREKKRDGKRKSPLL